MIQFLTNAAYDHAQQLERNLDKIEDGLAIAILWSAEDVMSIAEENYDTTLSEVELKTVLYNLRRRFDAEIGINWDVIDFWVSEVISER
jgi:hypothetical protein